MTSVEYRDYIVEQIGLDGITSRAMMGEYLLYYNGVLFGGLYDNRLLVKITDTNHRYGMEKQLPYEGAKEMYFVEDTDNTAKLRQIVTQTAKTLQK